MKMNYRVWKPAGTVSLSLLLAVSMMTAFAADDAASVWKPAPNTLLSNFAKDVDPKAPLPEYPSPHFSPIVAD